jgi:ATP-dependent RNA circularization protein (DNA/RNA ligase family)
VLDLDVARALLSGEVTVEEKVDGANLGLSCGDSGELVAQNRGDYLSPGAAASQFRPLWAWMASRRQRLLEALGANLILFGEWCYARHSIAYSRLPDWFLVFDVYDRAAGRFWSVVRRDALAAKVELVCVPRIAGGRFQLKGLETLIGDSRIGDTVMEGIVVRRDDADWQLNRAKLVRPAFVQAITEHWSRRQLEPNQLADGSVARDI